MGSSSNYDPVLEEWRMKADRSAAASPLHRAPAGAASPPDRVVFQKKLQGLTTKIHEAQHPDDIILELTPALCDLFHADRLTIYVTSEDGKAIVSKVKTGLNAFRDLKLPINDQSIAGYAAAHRRVLNLRDVCDEAELKSHKPPLNFLRAVDAKTGYRTRQILVAPMIDARTAALAGVLQIINSKSGEPFPRFMEEGIMELGETLATALRRRPARTFLLRSKYDALVSAGVLSADELELAQRSARRKNLDLESVLVDEFGVKVADLGQALAVYFGVRYEPFKPERVRPPDLLRNLSREFCETSQWVPLALDTDGLTVMTLDPEQVRASRMVNNVYPKSRIVYTVTTAREFDATLEQFLGGAGMHDAHLGDIGALLDSLEEEAEADVTEDIASAASDNELVKLVNKIIIDAYRQGASDIHIEPYPGRSKIDVRFRRDGSLMHYVSIPGSYRNAIAARIKIMCDLDISERRKPQDGKIKFNRFGPYDIELRVATIPSAGGLEDIVMRILANGEPIPLEKLGLSANNLKLCKAAIEKPYGLFCVCGPTGSGKTTTLHSVLGYLNKPDTKIWTAEDPVEITQKGLRQVQVNRKAGLDFATVMKAFLRADPDIIMVGEMRDKETVSIGIEASLTGHLVFATLHTNSAPESIVRLLDMGMDPFNFADALLGILAQRLAKRLCKCKEAYVASEREIALLVEEYGHELLQTEAWKKDPAGERQRLASAWRTAFGSDEGEITLYTAKGCPSCAETGYKGRVGLHELLIGTDRVKQDIQEHARVAQVFATGIEEGMRTLKQDGIEKVLQGITDIHQVRAVCIK
jgi:type II secretory ATPase GspE/PulE/Tfp pilus assembly ATPase PilB-like protein/GAF domain-containing protein